MRGGNIRLPHTVRERTIAEQLASIEATLQAQDKSHDQLREAIKDLTEERRQDVKDLRAELEKFGDKISGKVSTLEAESNQRKGARATWALIPIIISVLAFLISMSDKLQNQKNGGDRKQHKEAPAH